MTYTPLFVHSSYSLLRSIITIKSLVKKCKSLGLDSVAITDCHNLFGAMEFSLECAKNNIKGIIGCRARIEGNRELLLYCRNQIGYENLSYLITNSYLNVQKNLQPEIRWESLQRKSEGIIAIAVPSILCSTRKEDMDACAQNLGPLEWYVGVEHDKFQNESAYLSGEYDKPVVAISPAYFLEVDDQEAHDVMLCIQSKKYFIEADRPVSDSGFKLMTTEEIYDKFSDLGFAVENTLDIAKRCDFMLAPASPRLPKFKSNVTEEDMLVELAKAGLQRRINDYNIADVEIYQNRLNFELEAINKMGFAGYFLIVSDFIKFAKQNDAPVGPGRGSGSGSLVAWCIDITEVDPIRFELFFERFLNPGRVSLPDFDIDFATKGRDKVIHYVQQKYGSQCVAGIITFGSMSSRMVLKDVGRVFQLPYSKVDNLSKKVQILFGRPFSLEEMYERDPSFAEDVEADDGLKKTFEVAKKLEGLFRHVSAHAAGIIITNTPLYRVSPLYKDSRSDIPLVQFSMKYAETAGLVKFDFLGLTALDVIYEVISALKSKGIEAGDPYKIKLDDDKVFNFLQRGRTKGLFQFETTGITKLIIDMKADCIEDLIAIISLYRPGPMDNIPLFIRSKFGEEKIKYAYPKVDEILANTYGIMVYQEQILRIAQDIAGFSLAEADLLRRAMGKKIPEEMAMYKTKFVENAHKINGGDISIAEDLFNQIERFANYGFNKAHAAAYAIIGYIQAYLKTYYTTDFLVVSMTLEQHNTEKLVELIFDARGLGVLIATPCINSSKNAFEVIKDSEIRYSLAAIRNIGEHMGAIIIAEREKRGPFKSFSDLTSRVNLNKREIESLIQSGALDAFGENRGKLLQMAKLTGQEEDLLFGIEYFIDESASISKAEAARMQKDILGMYLDYHPLQRYPARNFKMEWASNLKDKGTNNGKRGEKFTTFATLEGYIRKMDRRNQPYLICQMSDPNGMWEGIVSNADVMTFITKTKQGDVWCAATKSSGRIIIDNISKIEDVINSAKMLHIKITTEQNSENLKNMFPLSQDGKTAVYIHPAAEFCGYTDSAAAYIEQLEDKYIWAVDLS